MSTARIRRISGDADLVRRALLSGAELRRRAAASLAEPVARAAAEISRRLAAGGTVFLFGNGGSASQAQHLAAELTGRFKLERRGLPAVALGANASELSSIANDYDFGECFERPLSALLRPGDVAIGLTGSGGSANVVRALRAARAKGAFAVALTSAAKDARGGPVGAAADLALVAPCRTVAEAQEIHLAVGHILCELIENQLAESGARKESFPGGGGTHSNETRQRFSTVERAPRYARSSVKRPIQPCPPSAARVESCPRRPETTPGAPSAPRTKRKPAK